ncbi:hypothetical protein COT94_03985 [Candidatus Falkowbacteria bacterium CG10_big_fil_rev_8_21_14_0_10_37_14]|uniref:Glycosyl transferase family 1 domain-containing protein n=1 Tax=Candidatus Falkowbacteria bacterium CG10_big_fil_rev_8_21_14_0_10_37_14 TaxID=1974561 RepID=A0A2M6WSE1_9BACT|nr:glycosyltransferase family 4 protein [Candidatus Falkowbacteria bacterium]PIT95719.1 MAG: hypothetical protein COT94_03985 [Candidatus Falkowbacteria bacterium CG10_big_fil_rev_8_21_14_0_10_37_14]
MKILTNDYQSNVLNFNQPAKGGPANFARIFYNYLKQFKGSYHWQGILVEFSVDTEVCSLQRLKDSRRKRSLYQINIPTKFSKVLTNANTTKTDPRLVLAEPISILVKLIKKLDPDIVFLNGFSLGNWLLLESAHLVGKPIVIQHAGIWTVELDIWSDFFSAEGLKIMKQMGMDSAVFSSAEIFLNNFSRNIFDKSFSKLVRPRGHKTVIIPLAVDFSAYQSKIKAKKSFNFNSEYFNIGVVARWDRIKNHQAVGDLAKKIKIDKLAWSINSVTKIPPTKKFLAFKKSYAQNINVIGHLSKEKIRDFCLENDLIIIPSKFDVSPTILLEAVACGTPVAISATVGFVDDYCRYGADDWVIDFNNTKKVVKQLAKIKGRALPAKLTKALIKKHQTDKVFGQYFSLFNKLITK